MNKLICMGDCVADFLPSVPGSLTYTAKMGGAPANVCVAVAKLGAPSYYLGKLAADNFGVFLKNELTSYGVHLDGTVVDDRCKTGLVFVDQYHNGDRDFFFYRDTPADANFYPEEIDENLFERGDVLHFCSIALKESPTKHAHERAVRIARSKGVSVSFDVNARLNLWKDGEKLKETVLEFLPYADIVKVTDDELKFVTAIDEETAAVKALFRLAPNAKIIFVTKGAKGSSVYDRATNCLFYEAKGDVVVDTTGAGDCFIGSVIYKLLTKQATLSIDGVADAVSFAVAACAVVISKKGASAAMPTLDEVEALLK